MKRIIALGLLAFSTITTAAQPPIRSDRCEYELMMLERTGVMTLGAATCDFTESDFSPEAQRKWAQQAEKMEMARRAALPKWETVKDPKSPTWIRKQLKTEKGWILWDSYSDKDHPGVVYVWGDSIPVLFMREGVDYPMTVFLDGKKVFKANIRKVPSNNKDSFFLASLEPEAVVGVSILIGKMRNKTGEVNIIIGNIGSVDNAIWVN